MKSNFKSLCILLSCLVTVCCSPKKAQEKNPKLEAYRLIDEQRPDEAIELLESKLDQDPKNVEYQIILATAYASKAGIKFQILLPAFMNSAKISKVNSASIDNNKSPQIIFTKLSSQLLQYRNFLENYIAIPNINNQDATYLRHALAILKEFNDQLKPSDILYRAILKVILFKYMVFEKLLSNSQFELSNTDAETKCTLDISYINDTFLELSNLFIDILSDLALVDPKNKNELQKLADATAENTSNITVWFLDINSSTDPSKSVLRDNLIKIGFGKIIKCLN